MLKAALVGAMALATVGTLPALAIDSANESAQVQTASAGFAVTSGHIARLKAALNLTPAQERHWGAVESALRALVRVDAAGLKRLLAAAQPLIRTLDPEQKQQAVTLARALGIGNLAWAL
jgi:hypothetical protein